MNFQQFEDLILSLFNRKTSLIRQASAFTVKVNEMGPHTIIEVYDDDLKVGVMDFEAEETQSEKVVAVDLVMVQKEYEGTSAALKLLTKFRQIYKEKYWGWSIYANFYNQKLHQLFVDAIEHGKFPPGVDKTKVSNIGNSYYQSWTQQVENSQFGKDKLIKKVRDANIPKPYKRYSDQSSANLLGWDVIYKNLTKEQFNALNEIAMQGDDGAINILMIDNGGNRFYGFAGYYPDSEILRDIKPKLIYFIGAHDVAVKNLQILKETQPLLESELGKNLFSEPLMVSFTNPESLEFNYGQNTVLNSQEDLDSQLNQK